MTLPCPLPGCDVDRVIRSPDRLVIVAHHRRDHGRCPSCGTSSAAVHSRYDRHPVDLPSFGRTVRLRLRVRRFYCHHPACRRRTFAEPLPRLLPPRARRTRRLARAQARIGLALGGEAGARLLPHLAMTASPDTVLRLVHRLPLPAPDAPRVLGIDDWAIRKGRTYGTILVDLQRRRPIDLLPDRSGATVAAWLRRRPQITVVAQDRSTEYAWAATAGAPAALQVADRWHLLLNMRQALGRWLARAHGRLRRLPFVSGGDGRLPGQRLRAYHRSDAEIAASADSRARWLAAYEAVRRRHRAGETLLAIGRATGLARGTVRKYAHAEGFPERAVRRPNPSRLDPYLAHLERRMAEGCEDAMALWREVRDQGFAGTHRQVHPRPRRGRASPSAAPFRRAERPASGWGAPRSPTVGRARRRRCLPRSSSRGCWCGPSRPYRLTGPPWSPGSSRMARRRGSPIWPGGSRRSCAPAASRASSVVHPAMTSMRGSPRLARAASAPSRPSRRDWSRTGRPCARP